MTRIRFIEPPRHRLARAKDMLRPLLGYGLAVLVVWVLLTWGPARANEAFYQPESGELAGRPGSVIRSEAMPFSRRGATASRTLYRSVGLHGEAIAVSGVLIVPADGDNTNRSIVAWAHPTSGVATARAPSLSRGPGQRRRSTRLFG